MANFGVNVRDILTRQRESWEEMGSHINSTSNNAMLDYVQGYSDVIKAGYSNISTIGLSENRKLSSFNQGSKHHFKYH